MSPAKDAFRLRVPLLDETVLVHRHDRVERGVEDEAYARFALMQGLLGAPAFGEISRDFGEANDVASAIADHGDASFGPEPRSVLTDAPAFVYNPRAKTGLAQLRVRYSAVGIFGGIEDRKMSAQNLFS